MQLTNRFTVFGGSFSAEQCFQRACQKAERSKWWKKLWVSGLSGLAYQALNRKSNWPYVQNLMACNHNKQDKITLKKHVTSILKESKRMEQILTFSFLTMVVHPLVIIIMGNSSSKKAVQQWEKSCRELKMITLEAIIECECGYGRDCCLTTIVWKLIWNLVWVWIAFAAGEMA